MCYIFEQRNQEGGHGSDQAHPCYPNPSLPHLQRKVEWKAKVLLRGICLYTAQTYHLVYPWLCQEELLYRYILLFLNICLFVLLFAFTPLFLVSPEEGKRYCVTYKASLS